MLMSTPTLARTCDDLARAWAAELEEGGYLDVQIEALEGGMIVYAHHPKTGARDGLLFTPDTDGWKFDPTIQVREVGKCTSQDDQVVGYFRLYQEISVRAEETVTPPEPISFRGVSRDSIFK
jgi:hypothetical protein